MRWLLPNGLEMSRPAGEGRAAWADTSYPGPVRPAKDQTQAKDTLACRPESIGLQLATGPGRPGRLHRVVGRPVLSSSGMRSPAGGRRAPDGFGSKERSSLAGDALHNEGTGLILSLKSLRGRTTASRRAAWPPRATCVRVRPASQAPHHRLRANFTDRIRRRAVQSQSAAAGNGTRQARSAPSSCWTPSTFLLGSRIPGWRATCAGRVRQRRSRPPGGQRPQSGHFESSSI
jgi:hypothetical protein